MVITYYLSIYLVGFDPRSNFGRNIFVIANQKNIGQIITFFLVFLLNELLNSISCNGRSNIFCHFHLGTETALVFPINEIFNISLILFGYDDDHTTILFFLYRCVTPWLVVHEHALVCVFKAGKCTFLVQNIFALLRSFAHCHSDFRIDAQRLCHRVILQRRKVYNLSTHITKDKRIIKRGDLSREEFVLRVALSINVRDLFRIFVTHNHALGGCNQDIFLFDEL
ncbi:hypothetical protein Pgin01_02005 [Porphyromonas gingivalis]